MSEIKMNVQSVSNNIAKHGIQKTNEHSDTIEKKPQKETSLQEEIKPIKDEKILENAVEQANEALKKSDRYIQREVHEVTHSIMYKLRDSVTNEVIAEFPPKKFQDMIAKMWEMAGLFVDEKA